MMLPWTLLLTNMRAGPKSATTSSSAPRTMAWSWRSLSSGSRRGKRVSQTPLAGPCSVALSLQSGRLSLFDLHAALSSPPFPPRQLHPPLATRLLPSPTALRRIALPTLLPTHPLPNLPPASRSPLPHHPTRPLLPLNYPFPMSVQTPLRCAWTCPVCSLSLSSVRCCSSWQTPPTHPLLPLFPLPPCRCPCTAPRPARYGL